MPTELNDAEVFGTAELTDAEVFGTGSSVKAELSDQDVGLNVPGEIGGTINEFKRGLLAGQQQLAAAERASLPKGPTMGQAYRAHVQGMSNPRYFIANMIAGDDRKKLQRVESTLGPTAKLDMVRTEIAASKQASDQQIADLEQRQQAIPSSAAMAEWNAADNSNWWQVLAKNPVEIAAGITAQSIPAMAPGMALNMITPGGKVVKAIGTGTGSFGVEAANSYLDAARQTGTDFTDPEQVREFFDNPEAQAKAKTFALKRGLPIGVFDALTAGLAGKFMAPALRQGVTPIIRAAGKEVALQAAGGSLGETAGQVVAGQKLSVKDIVAEAVGEIASGPQEIVSTWRERQAQLPPDVQADLNRGKINISQEPPPAAPPENNEFAAPAEEVIAEEPPTVEPKLTPEQQMAREAIQAMAELRAQKAAHAAEEAAAATDAASAEGGTAQTSSPLSDPNTNIPAATSPLEESATPPSDPTPAAPAAAPVTESHLKQARDILKVEQPPDVLDDVAAHYGGAIQFPAADHANTLQVVRETVAQAQFQRPYEKLTKKQKARVDAAHRISTDTGEPADTALQNLAAENPRYADWTADDLAEAMQAAATTRHAPATGSAQVRALAQEIANAEAGHAQTGEMTDADVGIDQPFSLAPNTPAATAQRYATLQLAQPAAAGRKVRVFHNPNATVNGQMVEGTVDADGTIALNSAAPRMQDPAYVAAKVRHEAAHVDLTTPEAAKQLDRLAGKLTAAQTAALQKLGYRQPPGMSNADYERWLANEFIARQAEQNTAWWQRYVQHMADWLRGRKGLKDITNEEVAQAILRHIEQQQARLTGQNPANYSLAENPRQAELDIYAQDLYGKNYHELDATHQGDIRASLEAEDAIVQRWQPPLAQAQRLGGVDRSEPTQPATGTPAPARQLPLAAAAAQVQDLGREWQRVRGQGRTLARINFETRLEQLWLTLRRDALETIADSLRVRAEMLSPLAEQVLANTPRMPDGNLNLQAFKNLPDQAINTVFHHENVVNTLARTQLQLNNLSGVIYPGAEGYVLRSLERLTGLRTTPEPRLTPENKVRSDTRRIKNYSLGDGKIDSHDKNKGVNAEDSAGSKNQSVQPQASREVEWRTEKRSDYSQQWESTVATIKGIPVQFTENGDSIRIASEHPSKENNFDRSQSFWINFDTSGKVKNESGTVPAIARAEIIEAGRRLANNNPPIKGDTYLRYGDVPKSGRSKNFVTGQLENGVSVYRAKWNRALSVYELADANHAGTAVDLIAQGKKPMLVRGEIAGRGSDGEPVLSSVQKIADAKYTGKGYTFNPTRGEGAAPNYSLAAPQTDIRRLTRQLEQAGWLGPAERAALSNRIYQVANIPAAQAAAADLLAALGPERAAQTVLDVSIPIPGAVRSQLMQATARALAQQSSEAYADFMNAAIHQTTDAGQFIAHLKGWAESTPEGAVATAQRILAGVADHVLASYQALLAAAHTALDQAHTAAKADTLHAEDIQSAAAAAVDAAIAADPEVQQAVRAEARAGLANDETIRQATAAALPPGTDITDVLNVVLDHFRFAGESLKTTLTEKLVAAGVPARYAEGFARSLETAWQKKVSAIQTALPKHLRNLRLSKEVIKLAENIVRGLETKAVSARDRLKAKFAPRPGTFSLAASPDAETISDLADVGAALLGRQSLNFAEWAKAITAEFGPGVEPHLEAAYPLAQQRLEAETGKHRARQPVNKSIPAGLPDTELNRLLAAKLRQWKIKMSTAVGQPQLGRKLGDAIVKDAGLTGPVAEKLRERINARFEAKATERKQKALARLEAGQPAAKPVKSLQAALRKLVELHNAGALDDAKFAAAIKAALGLKTLKPEEIAHLRQLAQDIQAIPEDQEQRRQTAALKLANALAKLRPGHWWDLPMGLWYAHILSGPATHLVNMTGNALNLAGTLAAVTLRNPATLQHTIPQLARGVRQALPEMLHALTEGSVTGARIAQKWDDPGVWNRFDSKWLLPWKLVGRALAAEDLLFFYPAYQVQQGVLARALARAEGLSGRALNRRVSEILFNTAAARSTAATQATGEGFAGLAHRRRVEEIIQQQRDAREQFSETGREFALRTTFNNTPYGLLGAIASAINSIGGTFPAVRLVVPFTNIIANVTNESLNYTPVGSLRALAARYAGQNVYGRQMDIMQWADRETLAELHAKAAVGTLLLGALVLKAASHADDDDPPFAITGQGPTDANKRRTLQAAGWLPNSVKVGNRYYSFLNTPAAVPLAVIGNMFDAQKYGKLEQAATLDRVALALSMTGKTLVQQSFLDSVARLMGAVEHPTPRNGARNLADWAGRTGSSLMVPNLVRQVEQIYDPAKYDDYTVQGELLRSLPFVRANNRPTLNGLGEPITRPITERFTKPQNPDPLWRELARLNVGVYPTHLEWQNELLTEEQLYEVTRTSGPKIRRDLEKIIAGPNFDKWNDETRRQTFDKIIQGRHKEAKIMAIR